MRCPPFVIAVAPNGARRTVADHPAIPLTAAAIAQAAVACLRAGACVLHLHVRDEHGAHTLDARRYRESIAAVRAEVGSALIVQITTEACGCYAPADQMQVVRTLRPESASMALRELFSSGVDEREVAQWLAWLHGEGVLTQYILYDTADLDRFHVLRTRGVIPEAYPWVQLVVGRDSPAGPVAKGVGQLLAALDPACSWSMCGFDEAEAPSTKAAAALGGHARVGFENNLRKDDGTLARDNAELVGQLARCAVALGRRIANADEARRLLGARAEREEV